MTSWVHSYLCVLAVIFACPTVDAKEPTKLRGLFVHMTSEEVLAAASSMGAQVDFTISSSLNPHCDGLHFGIYITKDGDEIVKLSSDQSDCISYGEIREAGIQFDKSRFDSGYHVSEYKNANSLPKLVIDVLEIEPEFFNAAGIDINSFVVELARFATVTFFRSEAKGLFCNYTCYVALLDGENIVFLSSSSDAYDWDLNIKKATQETIERFLFVKPKFD